MFYLYLSSVRVLVKHLKLKKLEIMCPPESTQASYERLYARRTRRFEKGHRVVSHPEKEPQLSTFVSYSSRIIQRRKKEEKTLGKEWREE